MFAAPGIERTGDRHRYRLEIEGLRAVAVLAVVLFHVGYPLSGGYIGVDVFFVISGYLITRNILKDPDPAFLRSDASTCAGSVECSRRSRTRCSWPGDSCSSRPMTWRGWDGPRCSRPHPGQCPVLA